MATKETDGAVGVDAAVLRKAIARYVTDDDENVFALVGLPEEVLAVLFAYYSRSSATLRENLALLIAEGDLDVGGEGELDAAREKARIFHEKWTVGYGHGYYDGATEVLTEQGWMSWPQLAAIPSPPRFWAFFVAPSKARHGLGFAASPEPVIGPVPPSSPK